MSEPQRRTADYMDKDEKTLLIELNVKLTQLTDKIDSLHEVLFGNGKPGLTERVLTLEMQVRWTTRALVVLGTLLTSSVFALLWGLLTGTITIQQVP